MAEKKTSAKKMTTKKKPLAKSTASSKLASKVNTEPLKKTFRHRLRQKIHKLNQRRKNFLQRRPHRSFRVTRRRDYKRSLKLPGYWTLTVRVWKTFWSHRGLFLGLSLLYVIFTILLATMMSQDTYSQLREVVDEANKENILGGVASTAAIFWGVLMSQLSGNGAGGSQQQIIGFLIGLFIWLTTIWLARALALKRRPKIRDGLYNSGCPVVALMTLVFVALIQIIPGAAALLLYGAADGSGLLAQTVILMLAGGAAILIVVLSLYWAVSTLFAMVIVTLPGMYPMEALRLAGDIVVGRRLRILLRAAWLVVILLLMWLVVLVPVILIDGLVRTYLASWSWLPLVPVAALCMASVSIVFSALYVYTFYRKVVEDDSAPAKN